MSLFNAGRPSFLNDPALGTWCGQVLVNERRCARSRLKFRIEREKDEGHPSGLRFSNYECLTRPTFSVTARREREVLDGIGVSFEDDVIKDMFGKKYFQDRMSCIPQHPIGPQNFNDRAIAQGIRSGGTFELVGRESIVWCTYLADAMPHGETGSYQHDPLLLLENLVREIGTVFPECTILIDGFAENVLRELKWTKKSHSRQFICKIASNKADGRSIGWATTTREHFIRDYFPALIRPFENTLGMSQPLPLFEVPHFHFLIAVFDETGEPVPRAKILAGLKLLSHASHQVKIIPLYGGGHGDPKMRGKWDIINAKRCMEYAIKLSGNDISDEDLLFRTGFRGLLPHHGMFSLLFSGSEQADQAESKPSIPVGSTLNKVAAERKRLSHVVKLNCPNEGLPESISGLVDRLRSTAKPFCLDNGSLVLASSIVLKNPNSPDQEDSIVSKSPNLLEQGHPPVSKSAVGSCVVLSPDRAIPILFRPMRGTPRLSQYSIRKIVYLRGNSSSKWSNNLGNSHIPTDQEGRCPVQQRNSHTPTSKKMNLVQTFLASFRKLVSSWTSGP